MNTRAKDRNTWTWVLLVNWPFLWKSHHNHHHSLLSLTLKRERREITPKLSDFKKWTKSATTSSLESTLPLFTHTFTACRHSTNETGKKCMITSWKFTKPLNNVCAKDRNLARQVQLVNKKKLGIVECWSTITMPIMLHAIPFFLSNNNDLRNKELWLTN